MKGDGEAGGGSQGGGGAHSGFYGRRRQRSEAPARRSRSRLDDLPGMPYPATVLTGDLDRLLAAEISALRPPPSAITTAGTWEPAPPGNAPGRYATPIAFRLADGHLAGRQRIA